MALKRLDEEGETYKRGREGQPARSCGGTTQRWPRGLGTLERRETGQSKRETGKEIGSLGKSREWEPRRREKAQGGGGGGDKASNCCPAGSGATGEREGSGNLKVKMQITQPGDGNPGGGGGRKGGGEWSLDGGWNGWKEGLWPRGSEVGPGTLPHRCLLRVTEAEKKCAPDPYQSWRPRPIPRASPGLRGAGGCWVRLAAARRVGDFIAMGR